MVHFGEEYEVPVANRALCDNNMHLDKTFTYGKWHVNGENTKLSEFEFYGTNEMQSLSFILSFCFAHIVCVLR